MTTEKLSFTQWNPALSEFFIKKWEGLRLNAYKCSANAWTIGHGHTKGVRAGMTITKEEAERLLKDDIHEVVEHLAPFVTAKLTEGQFIALVSLAFNVGASAVAHSKTLGFLNAGMIEEAKNGFLSFSKQKARNADGSIKRDEKGEIVYIIIPGLYNRRKAEVDLM